MSYQNPIAAALMAKMGFHRSERARVKAECIRLLASLTLDPDRTRLIGRFIEAYLSLDQGEINEYNAIMEAIPMAEKQAVTEILTYWEQQGLEKGLLQGLRQLILRQVHQRFGPMPSEDLPLLNALSDENLEQLGVAILTALDYAEWREQLINLSRVNGGE